MTCVQMLKQFAFNLLQGMLLAIVQRCNALSLEAYGAQALYRSRCS